MTVCPKCGTHTLIGKWTLEAERLQGEANRLSLSRKERLMREGMLGNAEGILRILAEMSENAEVCDGDNDQQP